MESVYILQRMSSSYCPKCNSKLHLLTHRDAKLEASFFICFKCQYVAQVGVGPVVGGQGKK